MRKIERFVDCLLKKVIFPLITLTIVAIFICVNLGYFFRNQEKEKENAN